MPAHPLPNSSYPAVSPGNCCDAVGVRRSTTLFRMALTASFAAESSRSWATDLHASDLSILIRVLLALSRHWGTVELPPLSKELLLLGSIVVPEFTIIKRIEGAQIFSKFDLKSGFHQVAMDEESILWTAFLVPGGLYEWLVMPFGLKNALAVFQ
ncbi:Orf y [Tanacetum coccineum]